MPRPLRVEYAGASYHVMCRGNRGLRVFGDERDREIYLDTLTEATERTGWLVHAWVLMGTHYHLLLETPEPNLVEGMKWMQGTFTQRHNSYHKTRGHVFQGRYKAKVIDDHDPSYFFRVADYIHLNPAAAGLIDKEAPDLSGYAWSSFRNYLQPPSKRPPWLRVGRVLLGHRITADSAKGRKAFEAGMKVLASELLESRRKESWRKTWGAYERGWVHGSEAFRRRMIDHLLEQDEGLLKTVYDAEQNRSYLEAAALKSLDAGLNFLSLAGIDLGTLPKGDQRKQVLAGWIKAHYTVSNAWLADQLQMGHPANISRAYAWYRKDSDGWKKQKAGLEKLIISKSSG